MQGTVPEGRLGGVGHGIWGQPSLGWTLTQKFLSKELESPSPVLLNGNKQDSRNVKKKERKNPCLTPPIPQKNKEKKEKEGGEVGKERGREEEREREREKKGKAESLKLILSFLKVDNFAF